MQHFIPAGRRQLERPERLQRIVRHGDVLASGAGRRINLPEMFRRVQRIIIRFF